jgi:high-affinity nickel-transport protein
LTQIMPRVLPPVGNHGKFCLLPNRARKVKVDSLPATWLALCALAFVLGLRHGFDADHLATIDGLTRYNVRANPRLARAAGALFSLGHGLVVIAVALVAGSLASGWRTPVWLEVTGASVSVVFLFGLAFLNVRAVLVAHPHAVVAPAGLKARLLGRMLDIRRAWAVAGVGMLFALSFDTVSQAALFALAAGRFGGLDHALFVVGLFVLGMLAVDGANGLWISRLIRRADRTAIIASRLMALAVAGISLAIGAFTVAKILVPAVDAWSEGRELWLGASVVASVIVAFGAAMIVARRRAILAAAT